MCEGASNQTQDLRIVPSWDRAPRFWNSWIRQWSCILLMLLSYTCTCTCLYCYQSCSHKIIVLERIIVKLPELNCIQSIRICIYNKICSIQFNHLFHWVTSPVRNEYSGWYESQWELSRLKILTGRGVSQNFQPRRVRLADTWVISLIQIGDTTYSNMWYHPFENVLISFRKSADRYPFLH